MTEEKKKPEEDEVTEEQLEDVAGGATANTALQDIALTKQVDKASAPLMDHVNEGDSLGPAGIELGRTTDDD